MSSLTSASPILKSPPCEGLPTPEDIAPLTLWEDGLVGQVQPVSALTAAVRAQMCGLLGAYFENVTEAHFEADLAEKEWAILITEGSSGEIKGFSTLMRLYTEVAGQPIVAFFSGDTIVARDAWGQTLLARLWARQVFGLAAAMPNLRAYWFLITAGYKTYRFLPVFFREFYPTYQRPTPPTIKQIIDTLGAGKYPGEYDPQQGVVGFKAPMPLRPDVATITPARMQDAHIAFLTQVNPGHAQGDYLACLAEVSPANLTRAGRRMLGVGG